ncbi:MAG: UDP-N-acetylmuramate--L-alanine ligase [Candidatus Algichlamydia australiensis]|nr:UDP-N-acetylmuramate--L-alanine ligase [Chlamydiales bacterium]
MTHFIGIGGIGMSALAHLLLDQGKTVTGSDRKASSITKELEKRGAKIDLTGRGKYVEQADEIVVSTAISKDHPEILLAKAPILHRSELLEKETEKQKLLAVTGSHGKTSTSALLAHTLQNLDSSYVVGGIVPTLPAHGHFGKGEYFVAEADESDGSFLRGTPYGAIITSTEPDHLDFWKTPKRLEEAYATFSKNVSGPLFHYNKNYGYGSDWQLESCKQLGPKIHFTISYKGKTFLPLTLNAIGEHQALNALAVFALCIELGLSERDLQKSFASFRGVKRRAEYLGEHLGAYFYDDYAHHPTEVKAILKSLRAAYPTRRIVALFQPHRYSRFAHEWEAFSKSFTDADKLIITDVWEAGEAPIERICPKRFAQEIGSCYLRRDQLPGKIQKNDLVVTLGAGDITCVLRKKFLCQKR